MLPYLSHGRRVGGGEKDCVLADVTGRRPLVEKVYDDDVILYFSW
jgi:hypothetical protein